jgi:hypothetical protein
VTGGGGHAEPPPARQRGEGRGAGDVMCGERAGGEPVVGPGPQLQRPPVTTRPARPVGQRLPGVAVHSPRPNAPPCATVGRERDKRGACPSGGRVRSAWPVLGPHAIGNRRSRTGTSGRGRPASIVGRTALTAMTWDAGAGGGRFEPARPHRRTVVAEPWSSRSGASSVTSPSAGRESLPVRRGDSRLDRRLGRTLGALVGRSYYPDQGAGSKPTGPLCVAAWSTWATVAQLGSAKESPVPGEITH